jgi:uncharacterized membrane protein YoaK (UPF0700 family)
MEIHRQQHGKNPTRKSVEHRILNAKPVLPELLAAAIHELSIKFSPNSAVFTTTIIMATISTVFSPVTGNPINPATTANSGNFATATRQLVKTTVKFRTSKLQSIAVFRDYHANFRMVSHVV